MPNRPARFCGEPQCPVRVPPPHRFCPEHRSSHVRRRLGPTPAFRIYDSARWRYLKQLVMREEPYCRLCKVSPTTDVDHIVEAQDGGAPFDRSNLQGLCRPCHVRKTRLVAAQRSSA
ncbi:MAG TPA: HNH endonuclease signature motif containing protein [Actinomycetota bacterium]|jgi:5-methylcytosine-specific restriction enzyme A|nr:HNH endonuclease signature motif containing protein [Actinomycetota bacterium]